MRIEDEAPPLLTVLLPVYNAEKWLASCLESLLDQSLTDFEVFLLDDGSTDATGGIARRYALADRRVQLFPMQKAAELSDVLNSQLLKVRSEWVARMDADDLADPRRFEATIQHLRSHPEIDVLGTYARVIDRETRKVAGMLRPPTDPRSLEVEMLFRNPVVHPSVVMRTRLLRELGGYPRAPYAEDYALWTRCVRAGKTIATLDQVLLEYGHHPAQSTQQNRLEAFAQAKRVNAEYAEWFFRGLESGPRHAAVRWISLAMRQSLGERLGAEERDHLLGESEALLECGVLAPEHRKLLAVRVRGVTSRYAEPIDKRYFAPEAQDYESRLTRRSGGYERGVPLWINDTEKFWSFARSLDIRVPRTLFTCQRESLPGQRLPGNATLLTTLTRSNYADGVIVPSSDKPDRLQEAAASFDKEFSRYTADATVVVADAGAHLDRDVDLYRFFAGAGEIAAVLRERHNSDSWQVSLWRDAFWEPAEVNFRSPSSSRVAKADGPPPNHTDLVHVVRTLSMALPTPFARIDVFDAPEGPLVLGAQLFPGQFSSSHSLACEGGLLAGLAARWGDAERWLASAELAPPARLDPRPGSSTPADSEESEGE